MIKFLVILLFYFGIFFILFMTYQFILGFLNLIKVFVKKIVYNLKERKEIKKAQQRFYENLKNMEVKK